MRTIDLRNCRPLRELNPRELHAQYRRHRRDAVGGAEPTEGTTPSQSASTRPSPSISKGSVGYYCAGMNKQATVIVHGSAGPGTAENMMSGKVRRQRRRQPVRRRDGPRRAPPGRGRCLPRAAALDQGHRHHRQRRRSATCPPSWRRPANLVVLGDAGDALGELHLRGPSLRARQGEEPRRRLRREGDALRASLERSRALLEEEAGLSGMKTDETASATGSNRKLL